MRKAVLIVAILFISPLPLVGAEGETIHLWSDQAPGPVLLWDDSGNLTTVDPDQPLDMHLPQGNSTLVSLIDGIPQDNTLNFNANTNATTFLNQTIEAPLEITGSAHLNILGPIAQSTQLNATWSSSISIPNTLGHPDLDDSHLGVIHQINPRTGIQAIGISGAHPNQAKPRTTPTGECMNQGRWRSQGCYAEGLRAS